MMEMWIETRSTLLLRLSWLSVVGDWKLMPPRTPSAFASMIPPQASRRFHTRSVYYYPPHNVESLLRCVIIIGTPRSQSTPRTCGIDFGHSICGLNSMGKRWNWLIYLYINSWLRQRKLCRKRQHFISVVLYINPSVVQLREDGAEAEGMTLRIQDFVHVEWNNNKRTCTHLFSFFG